MNRTKSTMKTIELIHTATSSIDFDNTEPAELIPVYIACVNKILQEVAISIATIADEIKEERQEREEKRREALDKVLFSSVIPEEEKKRIKEEFFESVSKNKEEGKK